jgi:sphinganine-1-phosphate aldolase
LGDPQLSILAYGSPEHDIPAIAAGLTARGWVAGQVTEPAGIHHMLNLTHEPVVGRYLSDLGDAMGDARQAGRAGSVAAPVRY